MNIPIYLDSHATTPVAKNVLDKMLPYFNTNFGNPNSTDSIHGLFAKHEVNKARKIISESINAARSYEIVFTSGATESNNLALIGFYRKNNSKGKHIISSTIEHSSVLKTLEYLENEEDAIVTLVKPDKRGRIDVNDISNAIRPDTILISIMFANNEIGTIQDIKKIGSLARYNNIVLHCDAAQGFGYHDIDVREMNIDLLSFSGHKIYGPKGIGGLYIRSTIPPLKLSPIIIGGNQERTLRTGTLNVPNIIGLAEATLYLKKNSNEINIKNSRIANEIINSLNELYPKIFINGDIDYKLSHNISITIPGVDAKHLIAKISDKISISTGSACNTINRKPSHVLKAISLSDNEAFQTIRIGLPLELSDEELDLTISCLKNGIEDILNL